MKIRIRLLLGFGVVVSFLVAVGALAIQKIGSVYTLQQTFYEHPFTVVGSLRAAHTHIIKMHRDIKEALLAGNDQEREIALAMIIEEEKAAYENLSIVKERFLGDKKLVDEILKDLITWRNNRVETIALLRENKKEKAIAFHKQVSMGIIAKIENEMNKIIKFALNKAAALSNDSREIKEQTIRFTFALLIVAAAIAIIIALIITYSITKPLDRAVQVADRLSVGDITPEIRTVSNDETGQLLRSMERMLQQFKNTAEIAQQIAAGDLSAKVTPKSEKDVMGNALVAMTEGLRGMAGAMERIAAGDLTVRITPQSEKDVMGNALSAMVKGLREITWEMIEGTNVLASASSEIMASTNQVASGATETAVAVNETTSTVEEVKQTAQVASQKSKNVSEIAQKAVQVSLIGRRSVEESIAGMGRIQEQVASIAESIVRLSEQSQTIGEIIATVNDLAEQSNLLAVNAAIEAAKAGEQGKGFAVVAQEVKNLAGQSKEATAQVRAILSDVQKATNAAVMATEQGNKAVEAGVRQSKEAGEAIRQMGESIEQSAQAALQIAASSQQQLTGMDQIAFAMENIRQASEQNVAGMKQVEATGQNLYELGQKLKRLVERYRV